MYHGPSIDDHAVLLKLSAPHRQLLETVNGYIAYHGGLHVRGACTSPAWHSLTEAWSGSCAIHRLFPTVSPEDVPFAQDALGDQFILRNDRVWKLDAEAGELRSFGLSLFEFDAAVREDPDGFLNLAPLRAFQADGGTLHPGELLSVIPPFVLKHEGNTSYRAIPAEDRLRFLSDLARQIRGLPEGARVKIELQTDSDAADEFRRN